ncbi:MAG TPA: hypothetical protein VGQ38_21165 [Gaiellaceae bacterium]|nr:hypothetical protein [Gaiellaceae bacterium]
MKGDPGTLRKWVVIVFGVGGFLLLPWTVWLSASLHPHHVTEHWDLAWSGFDSGLAILFLATALAAYRRSPWLPALAATLGTLLVVDAWFDVVLESHYDERRNAFILALLVELPIAVFCYWIAYRSERFFARGLHLASARKGASERDLIGVLEIAPDRESTGEPRDADASA